MTKPKRITKKQKKAIRNYVKKGYSANRIQKRLRARHMGLRRKRLLAEIRKIKHRKLRANTYKNIPKKYRMMTSGVAGRKQRFTSRMVALYGNAWTKRNPRAYSARFEFYGSGKDCQKAIIKAYEESWVPRKEWAFVKISAKDFLANPEAYAEHGHWDFSNVKS